MHHCVACQVEWSERDGVNCWACGAEGERGLITKSYRHGSATWHPQCDDREKAA